MLDPTHEQDKCSHLLHRTYSPVEEANIEALGVTAGHRNVLDKKETWSYLCFTKIILKNGWKGAKVEAGGYCNCLGER